MVPNEFELGQNYPNPFNPTTHIQYAIARTADVSLSIFDLMGREIKTLVSDKKSQGSYTAIWDGTDNTGQKVASGIYFYRLKSDGITLTKRMVLLR
ncbi:MAG: hypothetical protein AMS26_11695 [Bacteroides sp. SM23_62]|nr:MAG: hypothetical protein AMS26_11695 [Bacteroides sp. SM23_62]